MIKMIVMIKMIKIKLMIKMIFIIFKHGFVNQNFGGLMNERLFFRKVPLVSRLLFWQEGK